MSDLAPLAVAVPLIAAGVLAGTASIASRLFADVVSVATAAATTVFCAILLAHSGRHEVVYWFGGWRSTRCPRVRPPRSAAPQP